MGHIILDDVGGLTALEAAAYDGCRQALFSGSLREVQTAFMARDISPGRCSTLIASVSESSASQIPIQTLKVELTATGLPVADGQVERCLLVAAAMHGLHVVRQLRVTPMVQELIYREVATLASADSVAMTKSLVGTARFVRLAKIVSFKRFPAGQFEWEVSGISGRDLLRVRPHRLPATLAFLTVRMHGRGPVFFSHLSANRPHQSLVEAEANRSYYLMAQSMALQPEIRGFAACSWFRSPSTHRVSPNLAWLSRVFLEHGGWAVDAGLAGKDCGVLHKSPTRRALYEAGQFVPRRGLVMWPRAAMLAWANAHPELGSSASVVADR